MIVSPFNSAPSESSAASAAAQFMGRSPQGLTDSTARTRATGRFAWEMSLGVKTQLHNKNRKEKWHNTPSEGNKA